MDISILYDLPPSTIIPKNTEVYYGNDGWITIQADIEIYDITNYVSEDDDKFELKYEIQEAIENDFTDEDGDITISYPIMIHRFGRYICLSSDDAPYEDIEYDEITIGLGDIACIGGSLTTAILNPIPSVYNINTNIIGTSIVHYGHKAIVYEHITQCIWIHIPYIHIYPIKVH